MRASHSGPLMSIQATLAPAPAYPLELVGGLEEVADRYDLLLCDVWGVLHDGIAAFPRASAALAEFRARGGRVILVSNAPRPGRVVVAQLRRLGVPPEAFDDIRTSGDLTREIVMDQGERAFHHIGPPRDLGLFEGLAVRPVPLDHADYVVCTGLFDDDTENVETYRETLARMRERDLLMVCANPDLVVERGEQLIVCAGALAAAYEELGGRTVTPGKPHPPIYEAALKLGAELLGRPVPRSRVLAVGDAIRTDIAGGHGAGIATMFVVRGIHAGEIDFPEEGLEPDLLLAWIEGQAVRPTMITRELVWSGAGASGQRGTMVKPS